MGKEPNILHTVTKTLERSSTSKALVSTLTAAEKGRVAVILTALSSHYWRPDFSPAQAASMIADYCEDLSACRVDEIEVAVREYRLDSNNKFFPKSSDLRDIVFANRKHRAELDRIGNPVQVTSRPLKWWYRPKQRWNSDWLESDVPPGELICDTACGELREPVR